MNAKKNNRRFLQGFFFLVISIFFIGSVSAVVVAGGWNSDGNGGLSKTINKGQSADFRVSFLSMNTPMIVNVKLYNSNTELHAYQNNEVKNTSPFNSVYTVTPANYGSNGGTYHVVIQGNDPYSSDFKTLTLQVDNRLPQITSNAVTSVSEGQTYSYGVVATDADGDALTYTLVQAPNWLIMSGNTISGTAPFVTSDTPSTIKVRVSDGESFVEQTYTLTITDSNQAPTMSSISTQIANENTQFSYNVAQHVSDGDVVEGDTDSLTYSLTNAPNWLSISSGAGMISGTTPSVNSNTIFNVIARVTDSYGQFTERSFDINVNDVPDVTAPSVNITFPLSGNLATGNEAITFTDDELTAPEFSVDNVTWTAWVNGITLNNIAGFSALPEGQFTLYLRDTDAAGNIGTDSEAGILKGINAPVITITEPINGANYSSTSLNLIFSSTDIEGNLDSCGYSTNNGATIVTVNCADGQSIIVSLTANVGQNTWIVYSNDSVGNVASLSVSFNVVLPSPPGPSPEPSDRRSRDATGYQYQDSDDETYSQQISNLLRAPTINLGSPAVEITSFFVKFINAIVDFFRRILGFG
ncbi:MAG: putative Ig domain-containing protein [Nanoarchaeota archaeon]